MKGVKKQGCLFDFDEHVYLNNCRVNKKNSQVIATININRLRNGQ